MEFTEAKRLCEEVLDAESAGRDSNEMSIDGEHRRSYHFDVVSPEFDALLAEEGVKDSPPRNLDGSIASSGMKNSFLVLVTLLLTVNASIPLKWDRGLLGDEKDLKILRYDMVVALDGSGNFTTISKVIEVASVLSSRRIIIKIKGGIYQENLIFPPNRTTLFLVGMEEASLSPEYNNFGPSAQTSNNRVTWKGFKVITHSDEAEPFTRNKHNDFIDSNDYGIRSFENNFKSCQNVKTSDTKLDEENLILISADVSCNDENLKTVEMEASLSQMPHLTKVVDVNLADGTVEKGKDEILVPSPPIPEVATLLHSLQDASKGNLDGHGHDNCYHSVLEVAQSGLTKSGIVISSGKKRKGVEVLVNGDNIDKIGRIDRSPEVHTRGKGDVQLEQTYSLRREKEKLGDQTWNDEDLVWLLIEETRMLLYDIAYYKAKLQLLNVKRDKLLKKLQQLISGLQECDKIKLNFNIPSSSKSGTMDTQADYGHIHSKFYSQGKCQLSCGEVLETKQDLETLDSRAKALSELLYEHCKMEGDQSYTKIMKAVSDYLQKRMTWKSLLQNMKLWEIEDFERTDDCCRVGLNYYDYITQRFTANTGQSNIILSNSLNNVTIGKNFPNLDAFSAFVFVLNPHATKKGNGSSCMARETQITSSLLRNLLDVVEEVQSARTVLKNLVEAKFYSHSVQHLDLQLSFIDFYSGRKTLIDLKNDLSSGVYPAEVLPSQIYDPSRSSGEQKSLPSSLVDEIRTTTESVRVGYSRIIRLCRSISQAVHACNKSK
ncbi:hypothetical protein V8G54_001486 [Vigna mungo]|uniref:Pectinesterase n=1 Tax=Vigna mungo TaxID=3915 RepID=A0AAQ3P9E8_VIGMU